MRSRLLPLLIMLMAGVLLALGFPLAASLAAAQQQHLIVDRIDDTARFASLAQFVTARSEATAGAVGDVERLSTLRLELRRYAALYGIKAGVFYRDRSAMGSAPGGWRLPESGEAEVAYQEALFGRRSHDPKQVWPWQQRTLAVASPIIRDGDVVAVVLTESPTGALRSRILQDWIVLGAGELAAMVAAVLAAFWLTGWVLRPVRILDRVTHDIATGRMKSRIAAAGGPPELRSLARSFNEMADNVEDVLEQQRAFVADASHQLRNPLAALMLRIELLGFELPDGHAEIASVREEGRRLAQVLDDLLGLALAEHAEASLTLTDIAVLAAERVASWRPVARREGVELTYEGRAAVAGWADPVALSSALDAVVDNAVKFTPRGERVTVGVTADGGEVQVVVSDAGPGLTEEELLRVGDRFWRSPLHQNIDGSGLGLSIAGVLLRQGGGRIGYRLNTPTGLTVTLTVPRNAPH